MPHCHRFRSVVLLGKSAGAPLEWLFYEFAIDRHAERPFRFVTVVTDSISVCSAWYRAPSDMFVVANEPTARVLLDAGVSPPRVKALGFPVN